MKITVVGAGTAGAFAGAWAKKNFPDAEVVQIYSKDIPTIGVGESVTPHIWAFLEEFGIDQSKWIKDVNCTTKLTNRFENWTDEDQHFGFTLNKSLNALNNYDLNTYLHSEKPDYLDVCIDLYKDKDVDSFQETYYELYQSAKQNKIPNAYKQSYAVSHHIDSTEIANWVIKNISIPLGVNFIEGKVSKITCNQNGIKSVTVGDTEIESDYWLDCTGFARLLINEVSDELVLYKDNKPNTTIVMPIKNKDEKVFTRTIRNEFGWQFKIALQHRTGTGITFSDEYFTDDEVKNYLLKNEKDNLLEPRVLKWTPARMKKPRSGNVFAIGLAAGFVEPMEANALFHTLATIYRAVDTIMFNNEKLFDDIIPAGLDDTALFILAHYTLCNKGTNKFWEDMREIGIKNNHEELVYQKYKHNTLLDSSHWKTLFPDYMWAHLAIGWGCNLDKYGANSSKEEKQLVLDYLKSNRQNVFN
jgi:tryptophan halogenase